MGKQRPKHKPWEEKLAIVMSANALVQLLLDIIFEALHLVPTRINHLSLTLLNAFISFKTLSAIGKNRFSFLHEDCQILWLMEVCLIFGDVWYAIFEGFTWFFLYVRLFFLLCSLFNLVAVSYIMCRYELWSLTYKGHGPSSVRRLSIERERERKLSVERMQVANSPTATAESSTPATIHYDTAIVAVEQGGYVETTMEDTGDLDGDDEDMDDVTSVSSSEEATMGTISSVASSRRSEKRAEQYCSSSDAPFSKQAKGPAVPPNEDMISIDRPGISSVRLL